MPLTVAGSIFLARHKSLGMEETPVGTIPNLIDDIRLKVDVKRPRHMLAGGGLREESAEAIIVVRRRALQKATVGLHLSSAPYRSSVSKCYSRQDRARRCKAPLHGEITISQYHRKYTLRCHESVGRRVNRADRHDALSNAG